MALRGILALRITDGDGLQPSPRRTELILAAAGLAPEQIASLGALVNDAAAAGSSAREKSVIDRARVHVLLDRRDDLLVVQLGRGTRAYDPSSHSAATNDEGPPRGRPFISKPW